MSRLTNLLALQRALDDEIARERGYIERKRQLTERMTVAMSRGTWNTRTFAAITSYYNVDGDALLGGVRTHAVLDARHVAMWVMREGGGTYSGIGRELGMDHSTVMNGVKRVARTPSLLADATHLFELLGEVAA